MLSPKLSPGSDSCLDFGRLPESVKTCTLPDEVPKQDRKCLKLRKFLELGVSYNTASLSATDFLRGFATLSTPLPIRVDHRLALDAADPDAGKMRLMRNKSLNSRADHDEK